MGLLSLSRKILQLQTCLKSGATAVESYVKTVAFDTTGGYQQRYSYKPTQSPIWDTMVINGVCIIVEKYELCPSFDTMPLGPQPPKQDPIELVSLMELNAV